MLKKDQIGEIEVGKLTFDVKIVDVMKTYGRLRYRVVPVSGSGESIIEKVKEKKINKKNKK